MKGLVVLGATGSIGASTLEVAALHPDRFQVLGLAARANDEGLATLCRRFRPRVAAMLDPAAGLRLRECLAREGIATEVLGGPEALCTVAALPDAGIVVAGIVGAAGLAPTLAAVTAGKRVLLANKEALVLAGALLLEAARRSGAELLPVDSEHNAIFQCLPAPTRSGEAAPGVRKILLTASGGPFLATPPERLATVTPEQAVAHPKWRMGRKISVDSATLMNKGLEVIEACHLFAVTPDRVQVIIHPQSIVHSMVEFVDGSVLAQLGNPDMRIPIAHALGWPDRMDSGVASLDFIQIGRLSFEHPDLERFPCLEIAGRAARAGGTVPAVLNAANEVAVQAFLERRLNFTGIAAVIDSVLQRHAGRAVESLEDALAADAWGRAEARRQLLLPKAGTA
ncbi:MAG: 1-deoxy-D-xylulose-5-phosphate reductoisomerase [Gammaproteobacteria bacterium]|nr:MAG: 1-deoxy-D-xylulose-5-phosphate reductoisomerase [Gammaproteobacteria bacterium]